MPKFEANMNYIPPSPPSSMKKCNKSATVKFHMELLLILRPGSKSGSGATPHVALRMVQVQSKSFLNLWRTVLSFDNTG